jgi:hypothetical protein
MGREIKLSATRINTFLSCKQKYWFSYIEHLPKVANPAFKLGTACHEALEFAGIIWKLEFAGIIWKEKGKFSKIDTKKIMEKYDAISIREGITEMTIHKEGKDLVRKRLNNFIAGKKVIDLEFKFGFGRETKDVTTDDGIPLIGAIDKIEEIDQDTLLIVDYKTSKTAPTTDQIKEDLQLSIYDLVAHKIWPQYKRIILSLDFLKSDILYTYRTEKERKEFSDYLTQVYNQMVNLKEENVKANLNIFCPWCDFKEYCSTYQKACKKSKYEFLPIMKYTDDQLVSEWSTVKSTKKILEVRERELGQVIMEKIKKDSKNLAYDTGEVYIRQSSRTTYDIDTILKVIPVKELDKVVSINKNRIEKYMDNNPAVKATISETAITNYSSPFLALKKGKK